jgi:hypothetical protein
MVLRKLAAALAGAVTVGLMTAGPALAVARANPHDDPTTFQTRGIDKTFIGDFSGDWRHCNYVTKATYKQNVSCSQGETVSESVSGNVGFSDDEISGSVGFNVTFSSTVTATTGVTVNAGGSGWFDVGYRYAEYTIEMESRTCLLHGGCDPWSSPDKVTVQNHLGNTFHYFGTGAE